MGNDFTGFYVANVVIAFLALLAFPLAVMELRHIRHRSHFNFWTITVQMHFDLLLQLLSTLTMSVAGLFVPETATKKDLSLAVAVYKWMNYSNTLATNSLKCFHVLIFVERLCATVFSKSYETSKRKEIVVCFSILSWLYGLLNVLGWNVLYWNISILMPLSVGFSLLALFLIVALWLINKQLKKIRMTSNPILTQRYQIDENVRLITYIVPYLAIGSTIMFLAATFSSTAERFFQVTYTHPCTSIVYFTMLNMLVLGGYAYETMRYINSKRHAIKVFIFSQRDLDSGAVRKIRINTVADDTDKYFKQLKSAWNK